jgi:protein-S-isoprenylcysteine O-methyltransferase Ste14
VSLWRHAAAVLLLPGIVVLAVPALIVWRTDAELFWWPAVAALGVTLIALGLVLVAQTVALFAAEGRGTLAPWDPTTQLVVRGPYRYVRNPMISGVLLILLGEAAFFGSLALLLWSFAVFVVNAIYFPLVEEPGLKRRFGEDYETYRAHVPRWLPRLRPWAGEETDR